MIIHVAFSVYSSAAKWPKVNAACNCQSKTTYYSPIHKKTKQIITSHETHFKHTHS